MQIDAASICINFLHQLMQGDAVMQIDARGDAR